MNLNVAIVVDDIAADRQLVARVLRRAGWAVHPARNSAEANTLIDGIVQAEGAPHTLILTDLHMPNDRAFTAAEQRTTAGARLALQLRMRMEHGETPRMPIVALTALTEREMHLTALAFGCDAVLLKPATPDFDVRIQHALAQAQAEDADVVGAAALLRLLRSRLAEAINLNMPAVSLTEQDITKALLAYHRQGIVGLGQSALAAWLAPTYANGMQRGEATYALLVECLDQIMRLGARESIELLSNEILHHSSPEEQCAKLNISLSGYYRRRREAIAALFDLVTNHRKSGCYTKFG